MNRFDLVIKSDKVFIDGRFIDGYIGIKNGIIATISKEKLEADEVIDAEGKMVLPGTIDPHVHIQKRNLSVLLLQTQVTNTS